MHGIIIIIIIIIIIGMGLRLSHHGGSVWMYPHLHVPILSNDKTNLSWFSQRYETLIYKRYIKKESFIDGFFIENVYPLCHLVRI